MNELEKAWGPVKKSAGDAGHLYMDINPYKSTKIIRVYVRSAVGFESNLSGLEDAVNDIHAKTLAVMRALMGRVEMLAFWKDTPRKETATINATQNGLHIYIFGWDLECEPGKSLEVAGKLTEMAVKAGFKTGARG